MSDLFSLFNFVGENSREASYDPGLIQGQLFLKYNKYYNNLISPQLKSLQLTTMPGIGSIIEPMQGNQSVKSKSINNSAAVTQLEAKFNEILAEYTQTYKLFSEEIINNNNTNKEQSQYFNKVITTGDNKYTYVNNFGYTHKYSNDSWNNNDSSCPQNPLTINQDEENNLSKSGPNMGVGQACQVAGQNVINIETQEKAWIDVKGYKHIYSENDSNQKNITCDIPYKKLSNIQYNNIPTGSPMTPTTVCNSLDINPNVWSQLNYLNNQLLILSEKLNTEINELSITDSNLKNKIQQQKIILENNKNQLQNDQQQLQQIGMQLVTSEGEYQTTKLNEQSLQYHYIVFLIVAITVITITIHTIISGKSTQAGSTIVLLVCLLLVYYIFSKMYSMTNTNLQSLFWIFVLIIVITFVYNFFKNLTES